MRHPSTLTRRSLLCGAAALGLAGCHSATSARYGPRAEPLSPDVQAFASLYQGLPNEQFPVPPVDLRKVDPVYFRRLVDYSGPEQPGTIVVDTPTRFLYFTMENGKAMRYGVGIGRDGFAWGGRAQILMKRPWPTWTPPAEMIARQPELEPYSAANGGMAPGLNNPLGARALYLFEGGRDTLYRLHGTNEIESIGRAVSSGCVRLLNQDIIDLYERTPVGTNVVVRQELGASIA